MDNDQRIAALFPLVMLLATVALGWIALKNPTVPGVPDNRSEAQVPADEQDVVARLWEDPLQAVQVAHAKREHDETHSEARHSMASMVSAVSAKAGTKEVCLLVVPVPDTPFPDDFETRLRLRYSVQMALATENFAPDNRNYLGYFKLTSTPRADEQNTNAVAAEVIVPYEWFIPRDQERADRLAVLVLWLPETRLGREPLHLLASLQKALAPHPLDSFPFVFVVGPRSSDTLKKMVTAANFTNIPTTHGTGSLIDRLSIFSPQATTPDPLLGLTAKAEAKLARYDLIEKLRKAVTGTNVDSGWVYFHNFITPDDQLTDLLADELALRGIRIGTNSPDKILILTEADTAYGRSLPIAFQASCESHDTRQQKKTVVNGRSLSTPEIIQAYSNKPPAISQVSIHRYLRGLDQQKGRSGNDGESAPRAMKSPEEALAEALSKRGAMPLGESQLDYVDRLADDLLREQNSGKVAAVGVLGADIYDKLILLRSLRSKFPHAVFFTTDLDARLWHPEYFPFTRNMVVASAYNIKDESRSHLKIPPFRDGYQVAVFEATRAALRKATNGTVPGCPPAAIFELGRQGAHALMTSATNTVATQSAAVVSVPWAHWVGFGLLLGGFLVSAHGISQNHGIGHHFLVAGKLSVKAGPLTTLVKYFKAGVGRLECCVLLSLILLGCFYGVTRLWAMLPNNEPWAWTHGISVWPTEVLRLVIILAVFTTLVWTWGGYKKSLSALEEDYCLNDSPKLSAAKLFDHYKLQTRGWARTWRVLIATLAYMAMAFGAVFLIDGELPPRPHVRGPLSRGIDVCMMVCSVFAFLGLIFYLLHYVSMSARLLSKLRITRAVWPPRLLGRYRKEFHVQNNDLDGYIDVKFAADKSEETGKLILLPFVIQFVFILSRNKYFDNWSWPGTLIGIFVCNFILVFIVWRILRQSAKQIRKKASEALEKSIEEADAVSHEAARMLRMHGPAALAAPGSPAISTPHEKRRAGLRKLKKLVDDERRGAYSPVFQDPALLALFIPSGICGVAAVLIRALFMGA